MEAVQGKSAGTMGLCSALALTVDGPEDTHQNGTISEVHS